MRKNTNPIPPKDKKEEEETLHHAGDKGFKTVMKEKASALEYMSVFFPQLFARLDTTYFELDDTNYVSKGLKEYYSDVVYRTSLKQEGKLKKKPVTIVLLFEHKKSISSYFALFLQLLEYIVFIWREDWNNSKKPSIIIPIVVYQGEKGIKPKQLHDLFKNAPEDLLQYIPNLKFHLTNVQGVPDENLLMLEEKNLLRSLFLAYTYNKKRDKEGNLLIEIFKFIKHNPDKMNFFQFFFEYMSKENYLSDSKVQELFGHYLSHNQKNSVMATTYQIWVEKGLQEGRQEGRQEGEHNKARRDVLRGKWLGASLNFLTDQSELPYQEVVNMLSDYDDVYQFWSSKKSNDNKLLEVGHLSEEEVRYLMNLFAEKKN